MSDPPPQASNNDPEPPTRLMTHFQSSPNDPNRWEQLWADSFTPWARPTSSQALSDLLRARTTDLAKSPLNPPQIAAPDESHLRPEHRQGEIRRQRALVPGCGRGLDVALLAAAGFDALGVEYAPTAVGAAEKFLEDLEAELKGEGRGELDGPLVKGLETMDPKVGRGTAKVVRGDFFEDVWWEGRERYDLIYDYTFFSALSWDTRPRWAKRLSQLLAPDGRLVCLEFPTDKDPRMDGPPWATPSSAYVAYLSRPGQHVERREDGHVVVDEENPNLSEDGLVRIAHFKPEKTHEAGQGKDWVSVWRHQS